MCMYMFPYKIMYMIMCMYAFSVYLIRKMGTGT
jgi:Mg2+ and Co2+ transporter CorA